MYHFCLIFSSLLFSSLFSPFLVCIFLLSLWFLSFVPFANLVFLRFFFFSFLLVLIFFTSLCQCFEKSICESGLVISFCISLFAKKKVSSRETWHIFLTLPLLHSINSHVSSTVLCLFFNFFGNVFLRLCLELKPLREQQGFLSFRKNVFILVFCIFKRFLSLPYKTPLLCIPKSSVFLLVSFSPGFCLPLGFFSLFLFFHLLFQHVSLCSLCFVFLFLFGAHFSCSLSFLLVAIVVWAFFVAFRISCFFVFSTFLKKKIRLEKSHPCLRTVFLFSTINSVFFLNFFLFRTLPSSQKQQCFSKNMFPFVTVSFFNENSVPCLLVLLNVRNYLLCFLFLHIFWTSLFFLKKKKLRRRNCMFYVFRSLLASQLFFHMFFMSFFKNHSFSSLFPPFVHPLSICSLSFFLFLFSRFFSPFSPFQTSFCWSLYYLCVSSCQTLCKKMYLFELLQNSLFLSSLFHQNLSFLCFLFCWTFLRLI